MEVEEAEWQRPPRRGPSKSLEALQAMKVGDVKRIIHNDVCCRQGDHPSCTLLQGMVRLRKKGWKLESYHEKPGVLVVRRLQSSGL